MRRAPLSEEENYILKHCKFNWKTGEHKIPDRLHKKTALRSGTLSIILKRMETKGVRFEKVSVDIKKRILSNCPKRAKGYEVPPKFHKTIGVDPVILNRAIEELNEEGVVIKLKEKRKDPPSKFMKQLTLIRTSEAVREKMAKQKLAEISREDPLEKEIKETKKYLLNAPSKTGEMLMDLAVLSKGSNPKKIKEVLKKYKKS